MTTLKLLKPRIHNNYLLEIDEPQAAKKSVKANKLGSKNLFKKIITGVSLTLIAGLTLTGGLIATGAGPSSNEANAAFNPFDWNTWTCVMQDDERAYLGGTNSSVKSSLDGGKDPSPADGLLGVTSGPADGEWTALEQYGYMTPTYNTWQGAFADVKEGDTWPFVGSGGFGSKNRYGQAVSVIDAQSSPFFSDGMTECLGAQGGINAGVANAISFLPKILIGGSVKIFGWAQDVTLSSPDSPLKPIADSVSVMITGADGQKGLRESLFLDFLIPIIVLGALGLIWVGIVKRSSIQAGQSALWMIGASVSGILLLAQPLWLPGVIDDTVNNINDVFQKALISDSENIPVCQLPDGADNKETREVQCVIWYSTIYVPWVSGQFGVTQYNIDSGKADWMKTDPNLTGTDGQKVAEFGAENKDSAWDRPLAAQGDITQDAETRNIFVNANIKYGTREIAPAQIDWALYQLDRQHNTWVENKGIDYSEIAYNQLVVNDNTSWKEASGAVGASFLSLISSLGPAFILLTISFTLIAYQVTMLVLIAFSPLLFLVGVAPGWGRRIAMRWLELVAGLAVKRIVLMLFLLIFVKLYMVIFSIDLDWFWQALMIAVLAVVAATQKEKMLSLFTDSIDFGGNKSLGDNGEAGRMLKEKAQTASRAGNQVMYGAALMTPAAIRGTKKAVVGGAKATKAGTDKLGALGKKGSMSTPLGGEKRLGLGGEGNLGAHRFTTGDNLDTSRLNKKEYGSILGDDGKVDSEKANTFVEDRKKDQVKKSDDINKRYQEALEEKKRLKKMSKDPELRSQAKEEKAQLKLNREALRKEQADLNAEVYRLFGKADGDGKGNRAFNKGKFAGAPQRAADKFRPTKNNTKY